MLRKVDRIQDSKQCSALPLLVLPLPDDDDDDIGDLQRKQRKNTSRKSAKDGRASVRRLHARPACLPTACSTRRLF